MKLTTFFVAALSAVQGYTEPATTYELATTVKSTTVEPTRFPPRPVPNQAYAKLSSARNSWQTMMDKSNMDIRAYKERRVRNRFNILTDQMKARHEKLIVAGCSFTKVDEILIGMVFIDYNDTCRTTKKLIHDMHGWGRDFITDCEMQNGASQPKNIPKIWNRLSRRLEEFKRNMARYANCI